MEHQEYLNIIKKIKEVKNSVIKLPEVGFQSKHEIVATIDNKDRYTLVINRKGHKNKNNLTILFNSLSPFNNLVRFDVNGAPHENPDTFESIETPHLHIMTDEYRMGQIAIPLSKITNAKLIEELNDSLDYFIEYIKINTEDLVIHLPNLI